VAPAITPAILERLPLLAVEVVPYVARPAAVFGPGAFFIERAAALFGLEEAAGADPPDFEAIGPPGDAAAGALDDLDLEPPGDAIIGAPRDGRIEPPEDDAAIATAGAAPIDRTTPGEAGPALRRRPAADAGLGPIDATDLLSGEMLDDPDRGRPPDPTPAPAVTDADLLAVLPDEPLFAEPFETLTGEEMAEFERFERHRRESGGRPS
jgi:hypothetical protein